MMKAAKERRGVKEDRIYAKGSGPEEVEEIRKDEYHAGALRI
jgi:hypothetical protein